eukprot:4642028-Ditylum_brightwellii.AAC.1
MQVQAVYALYDEVLVADGDDSIGYDEDIKNGVETHTSSYVPNWLNIWTLIFQASRKQAMANAAKMHKQITSYFKKVQEDKSESTIDETTCLKSFNTWHDGYARFKYHKK